MHRCGCRSNFGQGGRRALCFARGVSNSADELVFEGLPFFISTNSATKAQYHGPLPRTCGCSWAHARTGEPANFRNFVSQQFAYKVLNILMVISSSALWDGGLLVTYVTLSGMPPHVESGTSADRATYLKCAVPLQRRVTCSVGHVAGLIRAIRIFVTEANGNAGAGLVIGGAVLAALSPLSARSTQFKDALQRSGGHQLHWDRDARALSAGRFASHHSRQVFFNGVCPGCHHTQCADTHPGLAAFVPTLLRTSA